MKNKSKKSYSLSNILVLFTAVLVLALQGVQAPVFQDDKAESKKTCNDVSEKQEEAKVETISFEATFSASFTLPQVFIDFVKINFPTPILKQSKVENLVSYFTLPFVKTILTRISPINAP